MWILLLSAIKLCQVNIITESKVVKHSLLPFSTRALSKQEFGLILLQIFSWGLHNKDFTGLATLNFMAWLHKVVLE